MEKYYVQYRRGDVWWLKLSSERGDNVDGSSVERKSRPYLIVSNDIGNRFAPIITVVPITTRPKDQYPMHVSFVYQDPDGTDRPQTILTEQITTVSTKLFETNPSRFLYALTPEFMSKVDAALAGTLGLSIPSYDVTALESLISEMVEKKKLEIRQMQEQSVQLSLAAVTEKLRTELLDLTSESATVAAKQHDQLVVENQQLGAEPEKLLKLTEKAINRQPVPGTEPAPLSLTPKAEARVGKKTSASAGDQLPQFERTKTGRIRWTYPIRKQFLEEYSKYSLSVMVERWGIEKKKIAQTAYRIKQELTQLEELKASHGKEDSAGAV